MTLLYAPETAHDGYKGDHRRQYPHGTRRVYSNFTPRGSRVEGQEEVVTFGSQYFQQRYLMDDMSALFFSQPKDKVLKRFHRRMTGYLGPAAAKAIGIDHIADFHDLGYVPLRFSALPEGTLVPLRVPMFAVENTIDEFFWMTNLYESLLSTTIWQPCTSATTAYRFRKMLNKHAALTGTDPEFVNWQGHDFSMRGMPGLEAAMASGAAHLLSFLGTDTVPALDWIEQYYWGDEPEDYVIGGSVFATEHSVMSAGGHLTEADTYERIIDLYPEGIVSIVSDTWDLWKVLTETIPGLKDKIMERDGKVVPRPDSGVPVDILCGDPKMRYGTPASKGAIQILWDTFGGSETKTGHRLLDPHIGTIYGDAITHDRGDEINYRLGEQGFASGNWVAGIGSFSYQHVTRDTYGFAMKATWADVDGEGRNLFKKPVTDDGEKFSATGRLAVHRWEKTGELYVIEEATPEQEAQSLMQPTWEDGKFLQRTSISKVRGTLWAQ